MHQGQGPVGPMAGAKRVQLVGLAGTRLCGGPRGAGQDPFIFLASEGSEFGHLELIERGSEAL